MDEIENLAVAKIFEQYPKNIRIKLLHLRQLIIDTASNTDGVGVLEETLKWGEPAYLTTQSKSGSTIRIGWNKRSPHQYAIYFNCKTTLVETFKTIFGDIFQYEGYRAIVFGEDDPIPENELRHCISIALTYHLLKKK
ncbi:MAG: DUF1801 domain-containing protein [Desulfuromusa sp.]|nr:DUF1801 domain-containing protein [Desulfuromusa sp.]